MSEQPPRKKITKDEVLADAKVGMREPNHGEVLANPINPVSEALRKESRQEFNPAEFRKFINRRVESLRAEIYSRGLTPSEVSKTWLPIRLGLDGVERKLLAYRETSDPAERVRLGNEVRSDFAQIEGEKFDTLYESTQEKMRGRPRSKGELKSELPKNFDRVLKNAAGAEAHEFRERELDIIANLRAQIAHLEEKSKPGRSALKADYEERILGLEKELRKHERLAKGKLPTGSEMGKDDRLHERRTRERFPEAEGPEAVSATQEPPTPGTIDYGAKLNAEFSKVAIPQPEEMAASTATPETVAEGKVALRRSVSELQDLLAERAGVKDERDAVNAAGQKYFEAYKELHREGVDKGRNLGAVVMRERAKVLEEEYARARVAYANKLEGSAKTRIAAKGLSAEKGKALQERYDRAVRMKSVLNEVVRPAAELKTRARIEGLNEKGKSAFTKALSTFAGWNQQLDQWAGGKTQGRVLRAAATAVLTTGVAAAAGAFGTAGLFVIAGYGAQRLAKAVAGMTVGTLTGQATGGLYERGARIKQTEAQAALANQQVSLDGMTLEALQESDSFREEHTKRADENRIVRNKALISALTAIGFGAGTTAALVELGVLHDAVNVAGHVPQLRPSIADTPNALHGPHVSAATPVESVSADHGDGGIRLLKHLHSKLEHDGVAADKPALARLFHTDPEKLARQLGLYKPGAQGGLENIEVPKGSTLSYTSSGEIVLTLKGGESVTLIDSAGHIAEHKESLGDFIGLHHAEHAPDAAPAAGVDHGSESTRILNQWELDHGGGTPPADLLHHAPGSVRAADAVVPVRASAPVSSTAPGLKTLQDFVNAPKPSAGEIPAAVTSPVPASSGEGIRTLGDFANVHESVLEPSVAHAYESVRGEYFWGGTGNLDDAAQRLAYEHHASVFVNHSYNDPLRGRVVNVTEFRPFGEGGKTLPPIVHTESAYDLDPEKDFIKRIN